MIKVHQRKFIATMILVLLVLNIWRWWPTSSNSSDAQASIPGRFNIEDFEVNVIGQNMIAPMARDLFQVKKVVKEKSPMIVKAAPVSLTQVKTPEEALKENSEIEFSKIHCVGVSIRNQRIHAYIISGGEPLLISKGDKVGNRFIVENIAFDGVILRDPETGVGGLIAISGK